MRSRESVLYIQGKGSSIFYLWRHSTLELHMKEFRVKLNFRHKKRVKPLTVLLFCLKLKVYIISSNGFSVGNSMVLVKPVIDILSELISMSSSPKTPMPNL